MPHCSSCSQFYRNLKGDQCHDCIEAAPSTAPRSEWPRCVDCSQRFEHLKTAQCFQCGKEQGDAAAMPPPSITSKAQPSVTTALNQVPTPLSSQNDNHDVHYAMSHPVNPRSHGHHNSSYHNPYQLSRREHDENDPRSHSAQAVFKDFRNSYMNASRNASSKVIPSLPKFKGAEFGVKKPVRKVNVVVRKIINTNRKSLVTKFKTTLTSYDDTTHWSEVKDDVLIWLDGIYSREHRYRLRSLEDLSLQYTHGKVEVVQLSEPENATVGNIWDSSVEQPGVLVQQKQIKNRILKLDAYVEYPPKSRSEEDFDDEIYEPEYSNEKAKRREHPSDIPASAPPFKRSNMNSLKYNSNIVSLSSQIPNSDEDKFTVTKLTLSYDEKSGDAEWEESLDTFTILIKKKHFSSGKTKNAFRLHFSDSSVHYAAKAFHDIGIYTLPSDEENLKHLKEELARQLTIKETLTAFSETAKQNNIPIYDLTMAESFILTISDGEKKGKSWLVDRLLNHEAMKKFSGTDSAGCNTDFAGMTCDAFAHFTLQETELDFVPVDIQGIDTLVVKNGLRGANMLVLFDIMAHSQGSTMGLGDNGIDGMKTFCEQHKCNRICKKLMLTSTSKLIEELNNDEDSDASMLNNFIGMQHNYVQPEVNNSADKGDVVEQNDTTSDSDVIKAVAGDLQQADEEDEGVEEEEAAAEKDRVVDNEDGEYEPEPEEDDEL